ncbi:MAG: response regulator transcription factor [Acidobacteriota bacterium]
MKPIRLVIADDHPIVLDGIEQLFGLEADVTIVARARSGEEALAAVQHHVPEVLIIDARMPGLGGLGVLQKLSHSALPTRIVLLAAELDAAQIAEAVRNGACGIVFKEMASEVLIQAVREVAGGGLWLDKGEVGRTLQALLRDRLGGPQVAAALTPREAEIVRMAARGLRNRGIAEQLEISEGTVKIHLHNIYEKLGVDGRLKLTLLAQRLGLT